MLTRKRSFALLALAGFVVTCAIPPVVALKARSDAADELADARTQLDRLVGAERRAASKTSAPVHVGEAPAEAFLNAQTPGLASAQLEAHVSDLAASVNASLASSSAQQPDRPDGPNIIRIQANVDLDYSALQTLLYKLESGAPYIFVESLTLRPANAASNRGAHGLPMRASLGLKALWRAGQT
jgi:general secretion pathway protein M